MNRNEKRRQKKLADKAAKASKPLQAGSPVRADQQHAIDLGIEYHTAGDLPKAESIYQQILQIEPKHPVALHFLGLIAHQVGKSDSAVDLMRKSLEIKPDYVDAHYNLGIVLKEQGKLDDAVASYNKALAIKPDYVEAYRNLGNALQEQGKLDDAVASYNKALAIKPDYAEAYSNLGNALQEQGKLDDAVANYHKALAIKPNYAEAYSNLGIVLQEQGKLDDAVASCNKALAINPNYAEAHSNLGNVFQEQGKQNEAFLCQRRAIELNPEINVFWTNFAASIRSISFTSVDDKLLQDLLNLLERPTARPVEIVRPIISALNHHQELSQIAKLVSVSEPENSIDHQHAAMQLSSILLFLRIIALAPIPNLNIERMLTSLRCSMLQETIAGRIRDDGLPFAAALALQCFTNEYVFAETDEEIQSVVHLQRLISELVEQKQDVPPSFITALGAYRPLHKFPWAQKLTERKWSDDISAVIVRQISEPFEELSLRSQFSCLTSMQNTVSISVREQYEENPYPRWIKTNLTDKGKPIGTVLTTAPLYFDLGNYQSPSHPEILIAGCGTGQHSLGTASRFKDARVLAVDLSLSSLSYAARKTNELGISNIEYAQADIMELNSLERQFDLIESAGVLHHLGDPLAGWKILVDRLRPGGVMKIGLYSQTARQHIVAGRSMIAEMGYTDSSEGIRQCRQDFIAMSENGNADMTKISDGRDFYSLSECRDLLFHVQEHRFSLPQINDALDVFDLKFLGFEMADQGAMTKFNEVYPNKKDRTSLALWHEFEQQNPDTFYGMYQFWCQKK